MDEPKVKPGTYPYKPAEEHRICRVCGCTDDHACIVEGDPEKGEDIILTCYRVEPDLCSTCAEKGGEDIPE